MSATIPPTAPLEGRFVRLEPLTPALLPELHAALAHPQVFAGGFGGGSAALRTDRDEFVAWALGYFGLDRPERQPWAVRAVAGARDGTIVGTSTLGDLDVVRESAHIGWTAYDPRVWGTAVNPECKLLLLGLAFDSGFGRVKLQADERNARSRAAILRLGARFEGIVRRDMPRADGSWRDTAVYSILVGEWPAVRAGLERRVAGFPSTA